MIHENIQAEFINGEIIYHSPVRMRHLQISSWVSKQLMLFVDEQDLGFVGIEK
ncbi:MAG: hypothetical protein HC880_09380 [Bacteroidia bacterium]|nr:hypothetical protein [Bacteroidia bacterium]